MSWRDCVAFALNRPLRDGEAAATERRFENAKRRRALAGEPSDDASVASAIAREIEAEAAIAKRNVYLNQVAYGALRAYEGRFGNKALAIRAALGGINEVVEGGRLSIDAQHKAIFHEYLGGMLADLRKAGADPAVGADLVKYAQARDNELAIRQAMRGEKVTDPLAAKIGEVFNKWFETARLRENRAGSWIGHLDDYGAGQSHDARKVWRGGFEAWYNFTVPLLDTARTMSEAADLVHPEPFLRDVWNGIAANLHDRSSGGEFSGLHKYIGPANLGKRRSQARVLHFKDAAAALAYNDRYGNGGLMEAVLGRLERGARATALMETLGPNPEAMLDRWRRDIAKAAEDRGDVKTARAAAAKHIDNLMAEVTGRTRGADPGGQELAYWAGALRSLESLSKLGAATLSSFGDIATLAGELRYQGAGWLSSYAQAFSGLFRGRGAGETRAIAELLGVGFDGIVGGVHARFHSTDGVPGQMSRLLNLFFRFNGLNWWTDAHKTTAGLMTARWMAMEAPNAWEKLKPETQRLLTQYDIGKDGWTVLRKAGVQKGEDGTAFLTPSAIRALDVTEFGKIAGRRYAGKTPGTGKAPPIYQNKGVSPFTEAAPSDVPQKGLVIVKEAETYYLFADGKKVGLAEIRPESKSIQSIQISELQRRKGYATALMRGIEKDLGGPVPPAGIVTPLGHAFFDAYRGPSGTRALEDARDRLATAYQAMIVDRADFAVATPGARERATMNLGTERGTILGEALRFVMQFKAFPLAMASRVLGRDIAAAGGLNMGAMARMGETIVVLGAMGYLSMAAKGLVQGKQPPDPLNVNTIYRALTQGGGLGIYGDFILGEHDRFGRSPAETALGPVAGTAGDIVKLINKSIRGETSAADALRFTVQNAPFLNLFYTRPALDYFVLNPIYESLKPGYLRRIQSESKKRYGQDYWWY